MKKPRIIVSVISDLVTDQRVHKVCTSLHNNGYELLLIGTRLKTSLPLAARAYKTLRLPMFFSRSVLFYAEFNIRLACKLLLSKADILTGNDLDTMPANFLVARLKGIPLVYDTHEYFLGQSSLQKAFSKKVWLKIERLIFPRLNYIYTVCESVADLYYKEYGKKLAVIMNVPFLHTKDSGLINTEMPVTVPSHKFILLLQGAGINVDRGAEELVLSTKFLDGDKFHLLIVGGGDAYHRLAAIVEEENLSNRVTLVPKLPFQRLRQLTAKADLGLSMDKLHHINMLYALPNKIFDYMHAGVPFLSTRSVEIEKVISRFSIGGFIENHSPEHIAGCITKAYNNPGQLAQWRQNTAAARQYYNWETEEQKLLAIYSTVCRENNIGKA